ncbi:FAD-binding oxidoreductase [Streptomyces sp. NBC_00091]|uniref:FAD-binding oxidoreductase n=1 Tax=Streptomyces sp. NBC_00091 TaxID=2975648 RepID=UPI002256EFE0|nr:FAD-linked oxidase C-terminal domain-containing protein [Streptomyces sp. NBC_00091]MCX5381567.1 FAD-binding protein [Streptomyces sp. NBC_00091]
MSPTTDTPLLLSRLRSALPPEALLTDPAELAAHSRDSAPFSECGTPAVVAVPRTAEQVEHIMRTAYELGVPVVPQGARTGLAGAANAIDGCVVLSTAAMDEILSIDPANRLVRCQPGVTTRRLAQAVAEHGLTYPPDPASWERCTIGGNIATGAGGICCVKYGVTADYVLGLDLVLPDGRRMRTGRDTAKGVAGYDLTRLIVGSEGTLAVVVGATLALRPARPPALSLLAQFPSLTAAGDAVAAITAAGHTPSALELLDRATTEAIVELGHPLLRPGSAATLIVESDSADPAPDLAAMAVLCRKAGAHEVATSATSKEAYEIIEARRLVSPAIGRYMASRGGGLTAFIEDVAVPRTALPELIGQIEVIAERYGLKIFTLGHAGDGNLHPTVVFDESDADEFRRAQEAYDAIMAAGLELGGTTTGEHGIGTLKREWLERELGPVSLELQRGLKRLFDPKNLLNPGKVVTA